MAQSLARIYVHFIFSTKNRVGYLKDGKVRTEMHAYLAGALKAHDCVPIEVGGTDDHVHALCILSKNLAAANCIREIKRSSSKWIKTKRGVLSSFQWQNGYGAFSVSHSYVPRVRDYIRGQEQHHAKMSFQDEFRRFLKRHGVEYDEHYVWD